MKKKLLLLLTVITLLLVTITVFSTQSLASESLTATVDGITWNYTLEDGKATNVYYESGNLPETLYIPASLDGKPVVSLYNSSGERNIFANAETENSINGREMLDRMVRSTGRDMSPLVEFVSSLNIKTIIIPESVTTIGNNAFELCTSVTDIILPDNFAGTISDYAFFGCTNLKNIEIPNNDIYIQKYAFAYCTNLANLALSHNITISGEHVFDGSDILKIYCNKNSSVTAYAVTNNILYQIDTEMPTIQNIETTPSDSSEGKVIVTVEANDSTSGLAKKAYSFDDGKTWQESNSFTCDNETNLVIKVRDKLFNTTTQTLDISATEEKNLESIEILVAPTKTTYKVGENFDKTGMSVSAKYNDGTSKKISTFTISDGDKLALGQTSVTISYTENDITKTAKQKITVNSSSEKPKDNTIPTGKLPNAGLYNFISILTLIFIISAILFIKYYKYKKI